MNATTDPIKKTTLQLTVNSQDTVYFNKPFLVKIILKNASDDTLIINKRLSVGYENTSSRELYFKIINPRTEEVIGVPTESYDRPPTYFEEYGTLKPNESISTTIDINEWQEMNLPKGKHQLELIAFYQADENYFDKRPENVVKGIYQSEPIPFYWIQQ